MVNYNQLTGNSSYFPNSFNLEQQRLNEKILSKIRKELITEQITDEEIYYSLIK
jgi:hypothetical protein